MATSNGQLPGQRFVVPLCRTPPVEIHPRPSTTPSRRMSLPECDLTRLDLAQTSWLFRSYHPLANRGRGWGGVCPRFPWNLPGQFSVEHSTRHSILQLRMMSDCTMRRCEKKIVNRCRSSTRGKNVWIK